MSSDLTFITNEAGKHLRDRFAVLLGDNTRFFDCLVGYFYLSGFHKLYPSLSKTEKIRILIGIKTDAKTYELIREAQQQELVLESHAQARAAVVGAVRGELEKSEDTATIEEGVKKFVEWIASGKLEIKAYPSARIHAKLYIMTFVDGHIDKGRVVTGSSNFSEMTHANAGPDIDEIIIGSSAKQWLKKMNLLPSTWGLPDKEYARIKDAGVRLTIMYSPASELKLKPNPLKGIESAWLILVDANALEKLSREESVATMLHEIGHVFHEMKPQKSVIEALRTDAYVAHMDSNAEAEHAADDYAFSLGYARYIASSLTKLAEIFPEKFNTDGVKRRITRAQEAAAAKKKGAA